MLITRLILVAMIFVGIAPAQPAAFEVASVKLSPPIPPGVRTVIRGGPGSADPGLVTIENADLFSLVAMAYGVNRHQLIAPEWLSSTRVDISARVPQGTTVDGYRQMLQNLLVERFSLVAHRDRKEMQIYDLVIAKGGSKLKEVTPDPAAPEGLQPPPPRASPPPGAQNQVRVNLALPKVSVERLAALLSGLLGQTIIDNTGLKGVYEVRLRAVTGSNPSAIAADNAPPDIFEAVQDQLGLKLTAKKDLVDVLVIDRMEKSPTEN